LDPTINITSLPLFKKQIEIIRNIISSKAKYNVVCCSRQFGKTTMIEQMMLNYTLNTKNTSILYVSPTYALGKTEYRKIVDGLVKSKIILEANKTDLSIRFTNGSEIIFRTASNPNNIRGGSYDYVFVDEFAFIDPYAWQSVIRQTLNVRGKKAILVSTPRGKNLFFELAQRGITGQQGYSYNYGHYSDNPFYDIQEVNDAKLTLPEATYRQEYEAEFLDDGGSVFPNISTTCSLENYALPGTKNYSGLDLGRLGDYTVLTTMNENGDIIDILRTNKSSWELIINSVVSTLKKYKSICMIEANGIGDPLFAEIKKSYKNVLPFQTTNTSKQEIIEDLILSMSSGSIKLPSKKLFEPLYNELQTFSFKYSPQTRRIIYGVIQGFHDDCVMSLAMCLRAKKSFIRQNLSFTMI